MVKDKSNGSVTKGSSSDETDAVKRKKDRKTEKKSKKMKVELEADQQVPEILVKKKKHKKHKKTHSTEDTSTKEEEEDQEKAEPSSHPAVTLEQEEGADLSPEEQRVLERKLKKLRKKEEKAKLKAEGKTVEKVIPDKLLPSQLALDYLTCWNENRKAWKFQKLRQTWLLQQMFDSEKITDDHFSVLLLYIEGLRGTARDITVEKAEALVKSLGDGPWDKEQQQKMQRAREVLQLLS